LTKDDLPQYSGTPFKLVLSASELVTGNLKSYVDARETKSITAIKPKPPFKPVLQVAASRKWSDIRILNEPLEGSSVFHLINA